MKSERLQGPESIYELRQLVQQYLRKDEFTNRIKSALVSGSVDDVRRGGGGESEEKSGRRSTSEAITLLRNQGLVAELAKLVMDHEKTRREKKNENQYRETRDKIHIKSDYREDQHQNEHGLLKVGLLGIENARALSLDVSNNYFNHRTDSISICMSWCGQIKTSYVEVEGDSITSSKIRDDVIFFDIPDKCIVNGYVEQEENY